MKRRVNRFRALSSKILLVLLGLGFGLAAGEVGARLLPPPYPGGDDLHACHRMLGWRGLPGHSVVETTDDYQHQVTWNSLGMHDWDHPLPKADGVFRILVLGDSFVEAQQVDRAEASAQVLQDELNALAPPDLEFEVIRGAIRGWGPAQQLIFFREFGQAYRPDLVLMFWLPANDLTNVLPYDRLTGAEDTNCYMPYFALCDDQFDPVVWLPAPGFPPTRQRCSTWQKSAAAGLNYLYYHSRLYQQLEPLFNLNFRRIDYANVYSPWVDVAAEDATLQYAYRLTGAIINQLATEAEALGATTGLVIVPFNVALSSDFEPSYKQALDQTIRAETGLVADTTLPNRTFAGLAGQYDLPVLDLHPHFLAELRATGRPLYWPVDPHWNVAGNRLAGETVAAWLIQQQLVPIPSKDRHGTLP